MRTAFNPKNEITNPDDLFGNEKLFKQLVAIANRKSNAQLVGLRRFGKTSLLKSLETFLISDNNAKVYPIYFDFKEVGAEVKGTANVYRYSIAIFISKLSKSDIFCEPEVFRGQKITPSVIWEDVYIMLQDINDVRVTGLFEEIVTFFSDLMEKTILFLFDEYEYLFRFAFDNPTGFMKLRNFTSKLTDKGLNPFTFFVSGSITWEHLCSITGSGELNCIDQTLYVEPIDFESFKNMWDYESNQIENCPESIKMGVGFTYKASGGVPFYGKVIGSSWHTNGIKPTFLILKSHFQELFNSLENEQKQILFEALKNRKNLKNSEHLFSLVEKGILKKVGDKYSITIGFFIDYIKSIQTQKTQKNMSQTEEISARIEELVMSINKTHHNKKGEYIFMPVNDDLALFRDLKNECLSADQFANFSGSLYHIIFERTKKQVGGIDKTKVRLPSQFRNTQFVKIVDILRHSLGKGHLMDSFTQRSGQMTKGQMLNILTGSKNEPTHSEDFSNLQIKVLDLFEEELIKLKTFVKNM